MKEKKLDLSVTFSGQQKLLPNDDSVKPNMPWVDPPIQKKKLVEKPSLFSRIKTWMFGAKLLDT